MSLIPVPPNPLEGELLLDQPILKCQEIYSILGQHQTMLVSKEEAKILKKEALDEAEKAGTDAYRPDSVIRGSLPQTTATPQGDLSPKSAQAAAFASLTSSLSLSNKQNFPRIRKFAKWVKTKSQSRLGSSDDPNSTISSSARSFDSVDSFSRAIVDSERTMSTTASTTQGEAKQQQQLPQTVENGISTAAGDNVVAVSTSESHDSEGGESNKDGDDNDEGDNKEQPLVGFWSWENTVRVHKVKMHVAEGSDLALHVVLAVVTNQLRLERNVLLTTV
eukprot:CAMPEP_0116542544 /NCGR_PEP_ID=MMETSP0397-20121206/1073_1 /TAXON_ID=216820 /ORGANISM="Cyclophora tenuis, Strain ECT3854" /LENGTH=276 /DNA_ID=CAMNT_0004066561 /DNA_START=59 /DNA_END=889 /DNA_ORIENTATION=-